MLMWGTKEGTEIRIRDMDTSHIWNCILYLKKRIKDGHTTRMIGGGMGFDEDDYWYDEEDITKELKSYIKAFKRELKKRGWTDYELRGNI